MPSVPRRFGRRANRWWANRSDRQLQPHPRPFRQAQSRNRFGVPGTTRKSYFVLVVFFTATTVLGFLARSRPPSPTSESPARLVSACCPSFISALPPSANQLLSNCSRDRRGSRSRFCYHEADWTSSSWLTGLGSAFVFRAQRGRRGSTELATQRSPVLDSELEEIFGILEYHPATSRAFCFPLFIGPSPRLSFWHQHRTASRPLVRIRFSWIEDERATRRIPCSTKTLLRDKPPTLKKASTTLAAAHNKRNRRVQHRAARQLA